MVPLFLFSEALTELSLQGPGVSLQTFGRRDHAKAGGPPDRQNRSAKCLEIFMEQMQGRQQGCRKKLRQEYHKTVPQSAPQKRAADWF